jgi:hypothetical protein
VSAILKGRNLVFWALTAAGSAAAFVIETAILDLRGYLCFSGLVVWSVLAAQLLR